MTAGPPGSPGDDRDRAPEPESTAPEFESKAPELESTAPELESIAPLSTPGLLTFTIEGREAPALFVVGWLGTIVGGSTTFVGLLAPASLPAVVVLVAGLVILSLGLVAAAGSQAIERRAAGLQPYAGPSPVLVLLAAIPSSIALTIVVGTPLVRLGLPPDGPLAALVGILLTAAVYVGLLRLLVVGPGVLSWGEMGLTRPSRAAATDVLWGVVFGVPVLTITALVAVLLAGVLPVPQGPLPIARDAAGLALNLLTAAGVAAVAEEIFFRGFATTAWLRQDGRRAALVRGALLFAVAHVITIGGSSAGEGFGLALFAFAVRLPVSFALGWLYLERRTVWAPIGLHATFNALPLLAALAATG